MLPFTLRQIEIFQIVCENASFSDAAEILGISQPSVSQQMAMLERQLGFDLFIRPAGGRILLSPDGQKFQKDASDFTNAGKRMAAHRREKFKIRPTVLNIYIGSHILEDFIRPNLSLFFEKNTGIELNFVTPSHPIYTAEHLAKAKVDIGVIMTIDWEQDQHVPGVEMLRQVETGVYGHKEYRSESHSAASISNLPFFMSPRGTDVEIKMLQFLGRNNIFPSNIIARSQYHDVNRQLWESGRAVGCGIETMIWPLAPNVVRLWACDPGAIIFYRSPDLKTHLADQLRAFIVECINANSNAS